MKQFTSIEKVDTAILYALELASSLSVLLLAFGLIASMANVLTKGAVLTENIFMQRVWAWTQCIAIDASVAGTIIRTFRYHAEEERVKTWLYGFLSVLLLFTAAIVSNIESVQQTLNLTLDNAYIHVFVPVEALIWIRSLAIVLLIVAHALRHVHSTRPAPVSQPGQVTPPGPGLIVTPELVETLRALLAQTAVSEETLPRQALLGPMHQETNHLSTIGAARGAENFERVKAYMAGQTSLPHDAPDPFVVDLPATTRQGFGHTTIPVASKVFTHTFNGGTKPLIAFLMRRGATVLVVPLPVDS